MDGRPSSRDRKNFHKSLKRRRPLTDVLKKEGYKKGYRRQKTPKRLLEGLLYIRNSLDFFYRLMWSPKDSPPLKPFLKIVKDLLKLSKHRRPLRKIL